MALLEQNLIKLCVVHALTVNISVLLVAFSLVAGCDWLQGTRHGKGNPGWDPPNIRTGCANISCASYPDHSTSRSSGHWIGRATPPGPAGRRSVPKTDTYSTSAKQTDLLHAVFRILLSITFDATSFWSQKMRRKTEQVLQATMGWVNRRKSLLLWRASCELFEWTNRRNNTRVTHFFICYLEHIVR